MAVFIDFSNSSTNFLGKQTNNSDQGAIIMQVAHCAPVIVAHCARVAKLKINVPQGKFISVFKLLY